ncbi:MAG: helix-turn-helix transcriptional regulator [Synergistaceae bacterium]|nr:helix-turn-helix transcriptional regulator [Synergistaceae bacterium]MBR0095198.1 helix-turn-helix transcriptional regulator [Synergistaceae bacterium]
MARTIKKDSESIGSRIRKLRKKHGWSQLELASMVHMSESAIGGYERGYNEPSLDMVISLANILAVSTDELLGLEGEDYGWFSDVGYTGRNFLKKVWELHKEHFN